MNRSSDRPAPNGSRAEASPAQGLNEFFAATEARIDRWRSLHRITRALATADDAARETLRGQAKAALAELAPLEDLNGYPGPAPDGRVDRAPGQRRLDRACAPDPADQRRAARQQLSRRRGRLERRGRRGPPAEAILPPTLGRGQSRKPYFEVLLVSAGERSTWPALREAFKRLRREDDPFTYEPVVVGTFEDAVLAALFNYNMQSAVLVDGFAFRTQHDLPALREILSPHVPADATAMTEDLSGCLARVLRTLRPELDIFVVTDHDIAAFAGGDEAASIRRVFYGVEEPMEIHLAILDGIKDRYETPFFDNLQKYARAPIGTFHALPVAPRQVDLQVELDPRHGRVLRNEPVPRRIVRDDRAASTACSSRPATSRSRRTRRRAATAATARSS
jgi:arginine decarboxylase